MTHVTLIFSMKVQEYKTVAEANPSLQKKFFTMVFLYFGEVFHIRPRNGNIISLTLSCEVARFIGTRVYSLLPLPVGPITQT